MQRCHPRLSRSLRPAMSSRPIGQPLTGPPHHAVSHLLTRAGLRGLQRGSGVPPSEASRSLIGGSRRTHVQLVNISLPKPVSTLVPETGARAHAPSGAGPASSVPRAGIVLINCNVCLCGRCPRAARHMLSLLLALIPSRAPASRKLCDPWKIGRDHGDFTGFAGLQGRRGNLTLSVWILRIRDLSLTGGTCVGTEPEPRSWEPLAGDQEPNGWRGNRRDPGPLLCEDYLSARPPSCLSSGSLGVTLHVVIETPQGGRC